MSDNKIMWTMLQRKNDSKWEIVGIIESNMITTGHITASFELIKKMVEYLNHGHKFDLPTHVLDELDYILKSNGCNDLNELAEKKEPDGDAPSCIYNEYAKRTLVSCVLEYRRLSIYVNDLYDKKIDDDTNYRYQAIQEVVCEKLVDKYGRFDDGQYIDFGWTYEDFDENWSAVDGFGKVDGVSL